MSKITNILSDNPIIPAVTSTEILKSACLSPCELVFILVSELSSLKEQVDSLKKCGKVVILHFDLVEGLSSSPKALDYLVEIVKPDGILSTRHSIIKKAKELGLISIQRFFLLDSLSLNNLKSYLKKNKPDAVEVLPGLMPSIIEELSSSTKVPIIAGGLIREKTEVMQALGSGAHGISTSNPKLFDI